MKKAWLFIISLAGLSLGIDIMVGNCILIRIGVMLIWLHIHGEQPLSYLNMRCQMKNAICMRSGSVGMADSRPQVNQSIEIIYQQNGRMRSGSLTWRQSPTRHNLIKEGREGGIMMSEVYWRRCSRCGHEQLTSYPAGGWTGPLFLPPCERCGWRGVHGVVGRGKGTE